MAGSPDNQLPATVDKDQIYMRNVYYDQYIFHSDNQVSYIFYMYISCKSQYHIWEDHTDNLIFSLKFLHYLRDFQGIYF